MRGLGFRLAILLGALALIVFSAIDVAFLLWAQQRMNRERVLGLRAAAQAAALELSFGASPETVLPGIGEQYTAVLTARGKRGAVYATAEVGLPASVPVDHSSSISDGFAHVGVPVPGHPQWQEVIASQPLQVAVDAVLAAQRPALGVLLTAGAVMVLLGLFFLRRAVLKPLARMTRLVGAHDYDALAAVGGSAGGDNFAQLGRAIIGMGQRISDDRERIARQLAELTVAHQKLRDAQEQLVRSERLAVVGQLAAGLAHEIGNPLTVLGGFVEMLQQEQTLREDELLAKALARMAQELDRIHLTIRQLLDFSRAPASAAGGGEVGAALDHVEGLLRPQDRMRRVLLAVGRPPGERQVTITSDALTQVLLNLALNAADAMADEGRLEIAVQDSPHTVTLTVDDSGPGIPEPIRGQVFEPFFTTKPAGAGTGLGLSVCERVVTAAGGDIRVEDSDLGGARFILTLPRS